MDGDMHIDPRRAKQLGDNLANVVQRIKAVNKSNRPIRLILVSKLKPASDILALHTSSTADGWACHFGENYFQELQEKASILPKSIKWHFIGGLQSNKCKPMAEQIPNLWCVSSVDGIKKADQLEKGRAALVKNITEAGEDEASFGEGEGFERQLRVLVQVNTSGEASKSGVEPNDTLELCRHIREQCPHLRLSGLMTIGAIARSQQTTPETENEDFICLRETRDKVAERLGIVKEDLDLSMGMSSDFEGAIVQGSDEVRIGSTIFGERPPKDTKAKGGDTG